MGINLGAGVGAGLQTFLTTGNVYAAAGVGAVTALAGGGANGPTAVGNLGNSAQNGWQSAALATQDMMNAQNEFFQLGLQQQSTQFDQMTAEKSELQRQSNILRDVAMQQRKADDQITKKFIESITG